VVLGCAAKTCTRPVIPSATDLIEFMVPRFAGSSEMLEDEVVRDSASALRRGRKIPMASPPKQQPEIQRLKTYNSPNLTTEVDYDIKRAIKGLQD